MMFFKKFNLVEFGLHVILLVGPIFFGAVYLWGNMAIVFALFLLLMLYPNSIYQLERNPGSFLIALSFVVIWISYQLLFVTVNKYATMVQLFIWLGGACGYVLVQKLSSEAIERLCYSLVLVSLGIGIYGLLEVLNGTDMVLWAPKKSHHGFVTGTYFNRNNFAGLIEIALGLQFGLLLRSTLTRQTGKAIFLGISIPFSLFLLLKSGSRMGVLSIMIAFSLMFIVLMFRLGWKAFIYLFVIGGVATGAAFFAGDVLIERLYELWLQMQTLDGRFQAWSDVWELIQDHALLGVGLGNFAWVFPQYQSEILTWGWDHAHNDYFEIIAELGIPAFYMMMYGFLRFFIWCFFRLFRLEDESFALAWGIFISLIAIVIHSITDFNMAIPAHIFIVMILGGALVRIVESDQLSWTISKFKMAKLRQVLEKFLSVLLRVAFILPLVLVGSKGWAGIHAYQGKFAFEQEKYEEAVKAFERVPLLEQASLEYSFLSGLAYLRRGHELMGDEKAEAYLSAFSKFQRLVEKYPKYGRGWLYLGIANKSFLREKKEEPLHPIQMENIQAMFMKAKQYEPHTSWMSYMVGMQTLSMPWKRESKVWQQGHKDVLSAIRVEPDKYLEETLQYLWNRYGDGSLLAKFVPQSYEAYKIYVEFLVRNKISKALAVAYPFYFELQNKKYDALIESGKVYLEVGDVIRAEKVLEEAYWLSEERPEAKLGQLIVADEMGALKSDYKQQLLSLLAEEDASFDELLWQRLEHLIKESQDTYLKGLYSYRMNDARAARENLEQVQKLNPKHRRFLAQVYEELGFRRKALELLRPVLNEKSIDLRDLLHLKDWDKLNQELIEERIKQWTTKMVSKNKWSGKDIKKNLLGRKGRTGMVLNLLPGQRFIDVQVRSFASQEAQHGVLLFRLQGKVIGSAYVNQSNWYTITFPVTVSGGRRWFEAELVNGRDSIQDNREAIVELGEVKVS